MKRKRTISNKISRKPEKKRKNGKKYPKKILRKVTEFSFVNQLNVWNKDLNLKNNNSLQIETFGRKINLKTNLYTFNRIIEVGVCLQPGQVCNIFGFEYKNTTRKFFISPLQTIKDLIINGENHLHEHIKNLPIKFFLDIDKEIDNKKNFDIEKLSVLNKLEHIKGIFEKKMLEILEITKFDESNESWIKLEASNSKKISFHLICNFTLNGCEIFFKNCEHVNSMIKWLKKKTKFPTSFIDDSIVNGRSLRMYFCSYKSDKSRIFKYKQQDIFDEEIFKKSLLQLHPEVVSGDFYQVELYDDDDDDDDDDEDEVDEVMVSLINQGLLPRSFLKNPKPRFFLNKNAVKRKTISVHILSNEYNEIAKDVVDEVINFLLTKRKANFKHLSKKKIRVYRVKKQNASPFAIYISLYFKNCLLQDYKHNHITGRTIIINPTERKIVLICAAGKKPDHNNVFYIPFRQTNKKLKGKILNFVKKTKNE